MEARTCWECDRPLADDEYCDCAYCDGCGHHIKECTCEDTTDDDTENEQ